VKLARIFRRTTTTLAFALAAGIGAAAVPATAPAQQAQTRATPNPALLAALVAVGGGRSAFSARTLRKRLGGSAEEAKLKAALGPASVTRFDDVFTFAVLDGLATMKQTGATLPAPAPAPSDTKAVAAALFQAGLDDGKLDVERLFDTLFSENVHMHVMMAVGQKYGAAGETAYHQVFGRLVADVGGNGGPISSGAEHHMDGMDMKNMDMKGMDMKGMSLPAPAATQTPHSRPD
jgi:hypothetical protein